jgi:SAM-dependent methyltransferase
VTCVHATGDHLPSDLQLDWVVSIGVLHHIPDPDPVLRSAHRALRPGGRLLVWVYGREGNAAYLRIAEPLRALTTRLPHFALAALSAALCVALSLYIVVARIAPVPLRDYVLSTIARLSWRNRRLVVYDQLRPTFAKYYSEREVRELLARCGFHSIATQHRHGYSWTAVGVRP